jgi:hypothetical protein
VNGIGLLLTLRSHCDTISERKQEKSQRPKPRERAIMPFQLPDEIEVDELADGRLLFRLPRRPTGKWRWTAVGPLVLGLLITGFPIVGIIFFLSVGVPPKGELLWFSIFGPLVCPGSFCFPLGGYLVCKGLTILYGHCEIWVGEGKLHAVERCGPLRWTKGCDLTRVHGFRVEYDLPSGRPRSLGETTYLPAAWTQDPTLRRLAQLKADLVNGKTTTICTGYPREWLRPLAEALSRCSPRLGLDLPADDSQPRVSEESLNPTVIEERYRQPSNSTARVEQEGDVLTITIPPAGLFRGMNPPMLIWCLGWNVTVWPLTALFLPMAFAGKVGVGAGGDSLKPGWAFCFLTPFWLVAAGSLIGLIHCARRRATFIISPTELTIEDVGVFCRNRHVWPANALRSIQLESKFKSDNEGGGTWSINLVVRPHQGQPLSFLEYRPKSELEWLATTLREALGLRQTTGLSGGGKSGT